MDVLGNREARIWVHMVKAMVPERVCRIIDQAIQMHGATGISQWTPLAHMYTHQRTLRLAIGADGHFGVEGPQLVLPQMHGCVLEADFTDLDLEGRLMPWPRISRPQVPSPITAHLTFGPIGFSSLDSSAAWAATSSTPPSNVMAAATEPLPRLLRALAF